MAKKNLTLVYPGDLNTRTGGYRYDKRICEELEKLDGDLRRDVTRVSLHGDFPFPDSVQLEAANKQLAQLADDTVVLIDGLAFSAMPNVVAKHAKRLQMVALIHHPLALETGLSQEQATQFKALETQALEHAAHVITTSQLTARSMSEYGVHAQAVTAILPGTDKAPLARHSENEELKLLCVATLTPRKGHEILFNALALQDNRAWHLHCVGSTKRHPDTYQKLLEQRTVLELDDHISITGELDDIALDEHYQQADAFVLASFHEGYGMVLTEAIAHGLPIICTSGGAMQDTVPAGCGLMVTPGDTSALAKALDKFLTDKQMQTDMHQHALEARAQLRSWQEAAQELSLTLEKLS